MKENPYDRELFFQKYSEMSRSKEGLKGAGEWRALQKLLPDFQGKQVLDLGCGYGWHCKYAAEHGAKEVIGTDISKKMLQRAEELSRAPQISYRQAAMEDLVFEKERFDVVFSSLAFHYIRDFDLLAEKIKGWLRPGGKLVFSVEHPVFTAYGSQDWYYNEAGEILHFPVDRYYYEGEREAIFLGEQVVKYHRTLTTYLETFLNLGFVLEHIIEPQPPEDMLELPGMRDEMRRPLMLLAAFRKEEQGR